MNGSMLNLGHLLAALVPVLIAHHAPYVHVHFIIDLGRKVPVVHRVSTVAQSAVL